MLGFENLGSGADFECLDGSQCRGLGNSTSRHSGIPLALVMMEVQGSPAWGGLTPASLSRRSLLSRRFGAAKFILHGYTLQLHVPQLGLKCSRVFQKSYLFLGPVLLIWETC